jgi:hypothetical protein
MGGLRGRGATFDAVYTGELMGDGFPVSLAMAVALRIDSSPMRHQVFTMDQSGSL